MILGFPQGPERDADVSRKFFWPEFPETFCDVRGGRCAGLPDLIAESPMSWELVSCKNCSNLGSKFFGKLPGNDFLVMFETRHVSAEAMCAPMLNRER